MRHPYDPKHWCPKCCGDDARRCENYGKRKYRVESERKPRRGKLHRFFFGTAFDVSDPRF